MTVEQLNLEASAESLTAECLKDLNEMEADYIRQCILAEPRMTHRTFSERWGLAGADVREVRRTAMVSMKRALAQKGIVRIGDLR
ncbi:MAG: hypothetical protein LC114_04300 [Bryobacterales bacterium]|nr:hypothetical protein [Bryobacterales bacterium]